MFDNEIWLRPGQPGATRFDVLFDSENGDGALFKVEIAPSQFQPAQITKFENSDLIIYGLRGRGVIETEDGAKVVLGAAASVRIPKGTVFSWRNELRDTFGVLCFLPNGEAAAFFDSLPQCADDSERVSEAAAYGLSLHLPPLEPSLPEPIKALENRVFWPQGAGFAI